MTFCFWRAMANNLNIQVKCTFVGMEGTMIWGKDSTKLGKWGLWRIKNINERIIFPGNFERLNFSQPGHTDPRTEV
jgi:hypothetical protein